MDKNVENMDKYKAYYLKTQMERKAAARAAAEREAAQEEEERALRDYINRASKEAKITAAAMEMKWRDEEKKKRLAHEEEEAQKRRARAEEAAKAKRMKRVKAALQNVWGMIFSAVVLVIGWLVGAVDYWFALTFTIVTTVVIVALVVFTMGIVSKKKVRGKA